MDTFELTGHDAVAEARAAVARRVAELGRPELADDARLAMTELVTNALLHGGGWAGVEVVPVDDGMRIEVRDRSRVPPVMARASERSMTGRGLRLVASLSRNWGFEPVDDGGKVVWAELTGAGGVELDADDLLAMWGDDELDAAAGERRHHVTLGEVPTDLLLDAKAHVDNLVREFTLAASGASTGQSGGVPAHLASLIEAVVNRFAEARVAIKHQALEAARNGASHTRLELDLPPSAADAAEEYLRGIDDADAYSRAARLLTMETPPQHRVFRHWYIDELVSQLRAAEAGEPPRPPQTFEQRMLCELDTVADAHRISERAARLSIVAQLVSAAATPEEVVEAVLHGGVAAMGASGGGIVLPSSADHLVVRGTVGYDEELVAKLDAESKDAQLPAATAMRTGEPVWLESREERDERFPDLIGLEKHTVSMCAVPLVVHGRVLGAMRFSFQEPRLFDEEERGFVRALAAVGAQGLDRAELLRVQTEAAERLERSLLPRALPEVPGVDLAGVYRSLDGEAGVAGDFYDVWPAGGGRWVVVVGDVAGTGPDAAATTGLVRHTLRALSLVDPSPDVLLRRLDLVLASENQAAGDVEHRCTAVLGLLTTDRGARLELAAGGGPDPFLRDAGGRVSELRVGGHRLGSGTAEVSRCRIEIEPGTTLVLYTDGVVDAGRGGARFGLDGLRDVLREGGDAGTTAAAIDASMAARAPLDDDAAALVVRVP